jgi:hypothetical protein
VPRPARKRSARRTTATPTSSAGPRRRKCGCGEGSRAALPTL